MEVREGISLLVFDGKNVESRKGDSEKLGIAGEGRQALLFADSSRCAMRDGLPPLPPIVHHLQRIVEKRNNSPTLEREREREQNKMEVYYVLRKV